MRFGMDFGGTNLKLGVFSADGSTVAFDEMPIQGLIKDESILGGLLGASTGFVRGYSLNAGGLAVKGMVDSRTGFVLDDIGAGAMLAGINIRDEFSRALGFPVEIDNDARSYAWGEYLYGAGQGSRVMVCMTLGTGFGCALVADEKPYEGSDPLGGILGGHISIDRNGPECPCGNRGCLELYCSATALGKIIREAYPELNEDNLLHTYFDLIRKGRRQYRKALEEFQENLALGIVNVIHAYGPDTVVLGGGVMNSSDIILPRVIELVHRRAWTYPRKKVKIAASLLGNRAAAMGAAFHYRLSRRMNQ